MSNDKSYHVFSIKDNNYIFDINKMICVNVSNEFIKCLNTNNFEESKNEKIKYDILKENSLFFYSTKEISYIAKASDTVFFSFAPITKCNLRCKYCFADSGEKYNDAKKEMDSLTALDISNYLIDNFPNINKFRLDFVSGGEPLLGFEKLKEIISSIQDLFKKRNKKLTIWLCTNATLLNEDIIKWLDDNRILIGISIDGPSQVHNSCRIYPDGKGTYDDVTNNIDKILCSKNTSHNFKYIWGLSVITSKTTSLVELLHHNTSKGFKNIQMKIARLDKSSEYSINESNINSLLISITELIDYTFETIRLGNIENVIPYINQNDYIGKIIERLLLKEPYVFRCYAGRYKFSFTPNGDIYPCDSFVGNSEYMLGNIYNNINSGIHTNDFFNVSVFSRNKCTKCWARFVCGGDCLHNALCTNGNIYEPDHIFCSVTKHIIENVLVKINELERYGYIDEINKLKNILRVRFHKK